MVRAPLSLLAACVAAAVLLPAADVSAQATASLEVSVTLGSRTALRVSSDLLQFDVTEPGRVATAVVDFSAGARLAPRAEVVLSVEPLRAIEGPGGAADVETALAFSGEGDGTASGQLAPHVPAEAGRWVGSGLRTGRFIFALRAAASGRYEVPVRFVLSTP